MPDAHDDSRSRALTPPPASKLDAEGQRLRRLYPHYGVKQARAKRRVPRFAYDYAANGVGDGSPNVAHNRSTMDAVRILPRYGLDVSRIDTRVTLFGQEYSMPVGVSPMGNPGVVWPGTGDILARAAQKARIPYIGSTVANESIEHFGRVAPDVYWFQLYPAPANGHEHSLDMVRRAEAAGAKALVVTLDVPCRPKRVGDVANGLEVPFRWRARTVRDIALSPAWAIETLRRGRPAFETLRAYVPEGASIFDIAAFGQQALGQAMDWDWIARMRDAWPRALVVKGILHPDDAERAVQVGCDGILVSNHGGRQFDAAPSAIEMLPAIAERVAGRARILMDGSIRSGLDILRALACGAEFTFAARAFLWSVAAIGEAGGDHAADSFLEELCSSMGQAGVTTIAQARQAPLWPSR
ncbi:alpha-hydroxy-acid oxidizing protein [Roseococcus sp. SYP-B2431]|uniref:alpha-hydroxy acid oxidase n=1 Tax=Roseococcus sp. SYP-B2431 TaxID=2496640 RepID=UPI00103E81C3|nr:alpha-hydroxy acid oxidase [Roseococcus sp. SYP-B2431]TCH99822.1 alpha-hydroxy-acid oxidizing protein [Roseococcus sp. SYP-B2431]